MSLHGYEEAQAPNHYFDRHFSIEAAKILPGEYYVSARDKLLVMVLSSCVAVGIRDPKAGIGGDQHNRADQSGNVELSS